ncbi:coat protein [Limonium flower distortion virus]|uniref:Capsid protein n=1 Tax=Limonium flower distortion virus TaxID=270257 RepID=Q64IS6_9TOMB|nr:coat protein [Limonium flower distortion virus]AAT00604.1 coat protein [Limonium flower distortion virus]
MTMVLRNNNNALAISKKQIAGMVASAAAVAVKNYVANNTTTLIESAASLGKKAYSAVRNRNKKSQAIKHIGGMGGAIMAPVAISRQLRGGRPKFSGKAAGSITVTHREYLTQISNTNGTFTVNGGVTGNLYQLNPLNGTLFSWLPSIAANFDQYSFDKVSIQYVPMCSTTEVGRVGIYWDKDSTDLEPQDRVELANFAVLKETPPWGETVLTIPVDRVKRFCDDSSTQDHKLIDHGQVGFAVYGGATSNACGDLFITYSVTLYAPQPTANLIETLQINSADTLVERVGPSYAVISKTATTTTFNFRATGIFQTNIIYQSTGVTTISSSGGGSFVEQNTTDNLGVATASTAIVRVTSLPATISYINATQGAATAQVVRASLRNTPSIVV